MAPFVGAFFLRAAARCSVCGLPPCGAANPGCGVPSGPLSAGGCRMRRLAHCPKEPPERRPQRGPQDKIARPTTNTECRDGQSEWQPPPGTAPDAPHPATSASACHPTVHIRLHHWCPPVSPAFGFACVHQTFQTGQSIALAQRYGAPSLLLRGQDGMLRGRGPPLLPHRDLSPDPSLDQGRRL